MRKLFWILTLLVLPLFAEATFYTSGYISMKYISGTTYQATIVTYVTGNPENSIACYDTSNYANQDTMRIYWGDGSNTVLNRSNGKGDSVCDCIKENTYVGSHTFSGPGEYKIWFDAIGRAASISNINNSVNCDMLIFNTLTINGLAGDSSSLPVIIHPPICTYGCTNECYNFNLDASSSGGDSISYSMGNCLSYGSTLSGFYFNPGATINPVTGKLSWCNPSAQGKWNFAILITTYDRIVISGHPIQIPVDTEEAELEVLVQPNCPTGINEITNKARYTIYPNPSQNGIFTISNSGASVEHTSIEVYNVLGDKVFTEICPSSDNSIIDLTGQPSGIYFYRILEENGNLSGEGKIILLR